MGSKSSCCCCSNSSTAGIQVLLQEVIEKLENFGGGSSGGDGGTLTEVAPQTVAIIDTVGVAYSSAKYTNVGARSLRYIQIQNRTDGALFVSLDGVADHFYISTGSSLTLNLGDLGGFYSGNIWFRQDPDNPVGSGSVIVSALY